MKINKRLYYSILSCFVPAPPEQGGILGMKDGVVCEYIHDNSNQSASSAVYVPDVSFLNSCIEKWVEEGIEFCGMIHSHPANQNTLSSGDMEYISKLFECNKSIDQMYFPLIVEGTMKVFSVLRSAQGLQVINETIEIV